MSEDFYHKEYYRLKKENELLRSQVEGVRWRKISEYPALKNDFDMPDTVMLWVADGGGRGSGCHAFGRIYRYSDGNVRAVASGFNGNWSITHWKPLDTPLAQHTSTDQTPGGAA